LSVTLSLALLTSCASSSVTQPVDVEARDIVVTPPSAIQNEPETPLENRFDDQALQAEELNVNRAEYYRQQSQNQNDRNGRVNSALSAAEYYIQAQDFQGAEQSVTPLYVESLNGVQADRLTVINAYVAYAKGEYQEALSVLEPLWSRQTQTPKLTTQQVDALLLGSFSYQALNDYDSAINALITRERSLVGNTRSETTRYIWQVINSLPIDRRHNIFNSTQNLLVRNRIEQSLSSQTTSVATAPQQFEQWREEPQSVIKQTVVDAWGPGSPRSIAVLLPITSKFNKAAQAVKDGINYQHTNNQSPYRPELRFYDIGDNPYAASQYYTAALQSGADFIIGPLGKDYANQVSAYSNNDYNRRQIPTLLLGGDTALNGPISRFTMSPEMEGARVACLPRTQPLTDELQIHSSRDGKAWGERLVKQLLTRPNNTTIVPNSNRCLI